MATFWDYNARALSPNTTLIAFVATFDVAGDATLVAGDVTQVASFDHNAKGEYEITLAQSVPEIVFATTTVIGSGAYVDRAVTVSDVGTSSFKLFVGQASDASDADMAAGDSLAVLVVVKNSSV